MSALLLQPEQLKLAGAVGYISPQIFYRDLPLGNIVYNSLIKGGLQPSNGIDSNDFLIRLYDEKGNDVGIGIPLVQLVQIIVNEARKSTGEK